MLNEATLAGSERVLGPDHPTTGHPLDPRRGTIDISGHSAVVTVLATAAPTSAHRQVRTFVRGRVVSWQLK